MINGSVVISEDGTPHNEVSFDLPMVKRLKSRYGIAVEKAEQEFTFEGREYVTGYAKYLLEYLENKLNVQE